MPNLISLFPFFSFYLKLLMELGKGEVMIKFKKKINLLSYFSYFNFLYKN